MNQDDVNSRVRAFIQRSFLQVRPGFVLKDDDPLFAHGVIDSMGAIELVSFLRGEFGITASADDVTEDNLGSIARIGRFVASRYAGADPR